MGRVAYISSLFGHLGVCPSRHIIMHATCKGSRLLNAWSLRASNYTCLIVCSAFDLWCHAMCLNSSLNAISQFSVFMVDLSVVNVASLLRGPCSSSSNVPLKTKFVFLLSHFEMHWPVLKLSDVISFLGQSFFFVDYWVCAFVRMFDVVLLVFYSGQFLYIRL
mgnify:CR=1 FL=1